MKEKQILVLVLVLQQETVPGGESVVPGENGLWVRCLQPLGHECIDGADGNRTHVHLNFIKALIHRFSSINRTKLKIRYIYSKL